jgi:long-chain acyl-CoA synthetase
LVYRTDDGARAPPYRRGMNLAANLTAAARRHPERPAVKLEGAELSYRMLETATARFAAFLRRRGVTPGTRVALMLPNAPELVVVYYGVLRAGGVMVPLEPHLDTDAVAAGLLAVRAGLLFAWHGLAEVAEAAADAAGARCVFVTPGEFTRMLAREAPDRRLEEVADDAPAVLHPRLPASLTHGELAADAAAVAALDPDDVVVGALPLLHRPAQAWSINGPALAGAALVPLERFELDSVGRHGATVFQGTPAMCAAAMRGGPALRLCIANDRVLAPGAVPSR